MRMQEAIHYAGVVCIRLFEFCIEMPGYLTCRMGYLSKEAHGSNKCTSS